MNIKNITKLLESINESKIEKITKLLGMLEILNKELETNPHITKLHFKNEEIVCEGYRWENREKITFKCREKKN